MNDYLPGFLERVNEWYRKEYPNLAAVPIVSVRAATTHWNGSTEEGFHDELELTYTTSGGREGRIYADEQESLWHYVLGVGKKDES